MHAGEEMAYREFYDLYYSRLLRYLLVVARGNEDSAREALQSTFIRVARHIKVFPDEPSFWGWLTVLARSALADQSRKRWRYLAFLERFTKHSDAEARAGEEVEFDPGLLRLLDNRLAGLPAEERELITAKYFDGQSVREIAGVAQISEKAVESRLTRVRRKLKTALLEALKHDPQ